LRREAFGDDPSPHGTQWNAGCSVLGSRISLGFIRATNDRTVVSAPSVDARLGLRLCSVVMAFSFWRSRKPARVVVRPAVLPAGFVRPCLPTRAERPPAGQDWLHEIKHDGMRLIARKDHTGVRLYSRTGSSLTHRFPMIVGTISRLDVRSCIIDGEAVAYRDGEASRELLRQGDYDDHVFLFAFDLIELDADDLRREPLEERKQYLEQLLGRAEIGVQLSEYGEGDGEMVFDDACTGGAEGIVSKRKDSPYQSGRSLDWLKTICGRRQSALRHVQEAERR
jgi:bifunctional non-homologous end joining protein LigD